MIQDLLTMIPGPTPVHERILAALGRPTTAHGDPRFVETFRSCLRSLGRLAQGEQAQPFVVAGSGTLAMEMAIVNLLGPGDRLLVVSQGYFGDRWVELAEAFGVAIDRLGADWGHVVPVERVARQLADKRYAAVAMTHVDTSTGSAAPVAEYCAVLRGGEPLVLLDGVCATAAMEERFDDWGVDVLTTAPQKALGAPPGLALVWASPRALERRGKRGRVAAYYADWERWRPVMDDPVRYFATPAVNAIVALEAAVAMALEEGLEARFRRHAALATALRAGLAGMGLEIVTDPSCLADTLTVVRHPEGIADSAFRAAAARRGVFLAAAFGELAGSAFRIGHMGNIGAGEICRVLQAIEGSLHDLGMPIKKGQGLAAAAPYLEA